MPGIKYSSLKYLLKQLTKPNTILGNVTVFFVLAAVEELLELTFSCPCDPKFNEKYVTLFFVLPASLLILIGIVAQENLPNRCSDYKKNICFLAQIIAPPLMWTVLLFLDGDYLICAKSEGDIRKENNQRKQGSDSCNVSGENQTLETEDKHVTKNLLTSQLTGGVLLLFFFSVLTFTNLVVQITKKTAERNWLRRCVADVTLDPQTAHPKLTVTEDLKRVSLLDTTQKRDDNESRFDVSICILGSNGFTSGRHYWEVQVANQTEWAVGVARVSVNRKRRTAVAPEEGYWAVTLTYRGEYEALTNGRTTLPMTERFEKLGVYLDCEIGRVSFYNADNTSHLHTFYSVFTEKVYPYFRPGLSDDGKSSGMLEICREKQDTNFSQLFPCWRGTKNVKEREQYRLNERNP